MKELDFAEIESVAGGSNWEKIGYAVGHAIGSAGRYVYDNVLMSDGWLDDINFMQP